MSIIGKNPDGYQLDVYIKAGKRISIPGNGKLDLLSVLTRDEIASSDVAYHVVENELVINDGVKDLSKLDALDLIKNYQQKLPTNADGNIETSLGPRLGSRKTIVTHNFCDPCTWYEQSTRQDGGDGYGQVLETLDAYVTYRSPDGYVNWIDMAHGKVTGEDFITGYSVDVTVDGYSKIEDIDYIVDYEDGYVTFDPALSSSNEVKASFSYETGSVFTIGPVAGKRLRILYTEIQFGRSSTIVDPGFVQFQVWVYNPADLPNKVPFGDPEIYKNVKDLVNISNGGQIVSKFGDMTEDVIILPFNYAAVTDLQSSLGAEIRISVKQDQAIDGYYGTLTAYCLSEDE